MRKLLLTSAIVFTGILSQAQTTKPKQEVKPTDTLINVVITPQQLKEVYGILSNTIKAIEDSDIPSKKAKEIRVQFEGLAAFLSKSQPKKEN